MVRKSSPGSTFAQRLIIGPPVAFGGRVATHAIFDYDLILFVWGEHDVIGGQLGDDLALEA